MIQRENGVCGTTKEASMIVDNKDYESAIIEINAVIADFGNACYYLTDCKRLNSDSFRYSLKFKTNNPNAI